jgi:hypothetical protein
MQGKDMTIGFTGTQRGMTEAQKESVKYYLSQLNPGVVRHGMCIGADADFHVIAVQAGWETIGHPGVTRNGKVWLRAAVKPDVVLDEKFFLDRNHDIVDASDEMLACPGENMEQWRSGTWATIRYARKTGKSVILVRPDGLVVVVSKRMAP